MLFAPKEKRAAVFGRCHYNYGIILSMRKETLLGQPVSSLRMLFYIGFIKPNLFEIAGKKTT